MTDAAGTAPEGPDAPPDARIRRLRMRSMRRGIKEMDIILSCYAAARLTAMSDAMLALYDGLLAQNDQDLYQWVSGAATPPPQFGALIDDIRAVAFDGRPD